jgi:hypothetical protein
MIGGFFLWVPLSFPVDMLGGAEPIDILDFRPIGIGESGYDCVASPFWFPLKAGQSPSRAR